MTAKREGRTQLGDDLVEAFTELAAYLRGEIECESYEVPDDVIVSPRVQAIRRKTRRRAMKR